MSLSRSAMLFRAPLVARTPIRAFSVSRARTALSEGDVHKDQDARHKEIDSHKEESLNKAKSGKAEWKKELASHSEAAVKADRGEIEASDENIKKMQNETAAKAEKSK